MSSVLQYYQRSKTCSRRIYISFLLHYYNGFQSRPYEQRTLYGALVVTLAMLLRLINCRFIISSSSISTDVDHDLFRKVCHSHHSLNHLLTLKRIFTNLRARAGHPYQLPKYTTLLHKKSLLS